MALQQPNSLSACWCGDELAAAAAATSDGPEGQATAFVAPTLPLLLVLPSSDNDDVASALSRRVGGFRLALDAGDSLPAANWALVDRVRDGVSIIQQPKTHLTALQVSTSNGIDIQNLKKAQKHL